MPPLNVASSATASGHSQSAFDNSGFVVNYGGGVSTGLPGWVLIAGAVVAGVWLWRRRR